ncbi:hypothetical protein BGZ83_011350, partial [Gryganskiella cystojenkinii]
MAPSALDIPDILCLILSKLDQETLLHRTRLVSHCWYSTSHVFILREVVWTEGITGRNLRKRNVIIDQVAQHTWTTRLSQASTLRCEANSDDSLIEYYSAQDQKKVWENLGTAIVTAYREGDYRALDADLDSQINRRESSSNAINQQQRQRFHLSGLKTLIFHRIDNSMKRLVELIPYLPQRVLTTLRLEIAAHPTVLRLDYIMDHFPNLNHLAIVRIPHLRYPHESGLVGIIPMVHPTAFGGTIGQGKPNKLRSLFLKTVMISSPVLEDLLLRSPHLESLELLSLMPIPKPDPRTISVYLDPPEVVTSPYEPFQLREIIPRSIWDEQRTTFQQELVEILKRCRHYEGSLWKSTLTKLSFSVWSRVHSHEAIENMLVLHGWQMNDSQGQERDHGSVNCWGMDLKDFDFAARALSRRAERMSFTAEEYPFETTEEEEDRVRREGPLIRPKPKFVIPGGIDGVPLAVRPFISSPRSIPNTLTTLDLCNSNAYAPVASELLHCYLCHSPQLRHLFAESVSIGLDNFDIFEHYFQPAVTKSQRAQGWTERSINLWRIQKQLWLEQDPRASTSHRPFPPEFDPAFQRKRIWACRDLETLQIRISVMGGVHKDITRKTDRIPKSSPVLFRILFGYLATVVPDLRVLELQSSLGDLELDSGICLLGRMQKLERLVLIWSEGVNTTRLYPHRKQSMAWSKRYQWPSLLEPNAVVGLDHHQDFAVLDPDRLRNRQEQLKKLLGTILPLGVMSPAISIEEQLWELGAMSQVIKIQYEMEFEDLQALLDRHQEISSQ